MDNELDSKTIESIDLWQCIKDGFFNKLPVDDWLFYYDETNNFRKFRFNPDKPTGYNIERALTYDFILGGIAFDPKKVPDSESLMDRLNIQKKNELKAKSILVNRNFLEDIGLEQVHVFLEWILDSEIVVHFSSLNNLYWAIIDLVDEAISTESGTIAMPFRKEMIDQLFFFLTSHFEEMTSILQRYGFPNISNFDINLFSRALSDFILENSHDDTIDLFYLETFRQIIKSLKNENELKILSGRESGVLIDSYKWQYLDAMLMAPNAFHFFDHEIKVEIALKHYKLEDGEKLYERYQFIDSSNDRLVQVSDVFVGILSELFHYTDMQVLGAKRSIPTLSTEQRYGIYLLNTILKKSATVLPHFQNHYCPQSFMKYRYDFLEMYGLDEGCKKQ